MDLHAIRSGRPQLLNLALALAIAGVLVWCLQGPVDFAQSDSSTGSNESPLTVAASELFSLEANQLGASGRGVRVPGSGAAFAWAHPRISAWPPSERTITCDRSSIHDSSPARGAGKVELRL